MNILLLTFIISFPLYLVNLELNPSLGKIYLRPDSEGKIRIISVIRNILRFLIQPFINPYFWNIRMWDVNYPIFYLITLLILFLFKKIFKKE